MSESPSAMACAGGYERVYPHPRVEDRDGYAINVVPDPLWECQDCGAVVKNMPRHTGWHLMTPARTHPDVAPE